MKIPIAFSLFLHRSWLKEVSRFCNTLTKKKAGPASLICKNCSSSKAKGVNSKCPLLHHQDKQEKPRRLLLVRKVGNLVLPQKQQQPSVRASTFCHCLFLWKYRQRLLNSKN